MARINKVIDILMRRDGMTLEEAIHLLELTREEISEAAAIGDYTLAEDIMYCNLGLEMDYLLDVI